MCGICGSVALDGETLSPVAVRAMLAAMVHRGPDGEGLFEERGIVAGARRLAVIDLASGDQPLANEDGSVQVVFNGEIYNFAELRQSLVSRGHRFRSRCDTEVLVHLWEEFGTELVHRLNGMFCFCIHDRRTGETFIARDRLGIKPLFFATVHGRLHFASEISVLLRHPEIPAEVDSSVLTELYCLQFVSGDRTVFREIRKLLPGHAIHVKDGRLSLDCWYEIPPPLERDDTGRTVRQVELRELLRQAVEMCTVADVPLGTFLSGGIDSTIVTGLLARSSDHPVQTFSVGFADARAFDERRFAREAAEYYRTEHRELVVSPVDIAEHLPRLVERQCLPLMDPAAIPTYLLSRFAREHVTVVLTGEGADELFGGYKRYLYQHRFGWLARLPGARGVGRGALGGLVPPRIEQALAAMTDDDVALSHVQWASVVGFRVAASLFDEDAFTEHRRRIGERYAGYFGGERRLADQLRADLSEWLPHNLLAKVDHASMAVSLEARVPFLDHRIVEWATTLPDDLRIRGGMTKAVLRDAFRDRLPPAIVERDKRGFDLPLGQWIRGPLRELTEDLLTARRLAGWPGLKVGAARELLERHLSGRQEFGLPLFGLLSVMLFLERVAPVPRAS
ncbi:MAG TPA: asparagine synthase (glutamine-hydrolyzing) [Candidatus Polarisedimenticolaceae bacterium]|nr:asparagine synthase (glutamine-hydrolyzing) [Candidatus Polarisedimenticolaceae bacterium]